MHKFCLKVNCEIPNVDRAKLRYLQAVRTALHVFLILIIWLSTSCNRCAEGEGPRVSRIAPTDSVGELTLDLLADALILIDSNRNNNIETITQEALHPIVMASNDAGSLTLSLDDCIEKNSAILFELTLNEAQRFTLNSAGLIQSESIVEQPQLWLTNKGLGDIDFAIDTKELIGEVRSSGDLILAGECQKFDFLTTSSGDLRGYNLIADTVVLNIFGSSVCDVYATKHLEVNFFSNGRVNYRGNPKNIVVNGEGQLSDSSL